MCEGKDPEEIHQSLQAMGVSPLAPGEERTPVLGPQYDSWKEAASAPQAIRKKRAAPFDPELCQVSECSREDSQADSARGVIMIISVGLRLSD